MSAQRGLYHAAMTVVVGYVPTPEGEAALAAAIEEGRRRDEPLNVLNIGQGNASNDRYVLDEQAHDALRQRLDEAGVRHEIHTLVRGKDPAEEIVTEAERLGASMVVIGIRRRTPTGRRLGSLRRWGQGRSTGAGSRSVARSGCDRGPPAGRR